MPWGTRQGWSGVGEAADEDDLPRVPFLDRLGDGARASSRRALSPELPSLPGDDDAPAPAPDATTATLPPAPWADRDPAAETRARAGRARGPKRKSLTPLDDALARALAAVAAHDRAPPSHFDRWRRILDDAERPLARAETRDAAREGPGPETARPARPARPALPTPAPSLTWDQHHVFLQYPPARRRVAAELPRGLTPAMLTGLYRSVEREQRRYMAHLDAAARADPDGGARYLTVGPTRVARAEEATRAREVTRRLAQTPRFVARVADGDVSLVAARIARLEPVYFERLEDIEDGSYPRDGSAAAAVPLPPDAFPRRGDSLADAAAAALEDDSTREPSLASSASAAFASRDGVPLDAALTSRAFACLAGNAPGRFHRAWDVPVTIVDEDGSGFSSGANRRRVIVDDPLPSRDAAAATVRARTAAVYESAIRARIAAMGARPTRLRGVFLLGSLRVAVSSVDAYAEGDDPAAPTTDARCKPEYRRRADGSETVHAQNGTPWDGIEPEEVSWDETASWWASLATRPPGSTTTTIRASAADGVVVAADAPADAADVARAGADAPPPPPHLPPADEDDPRADSYSARPRTTAGDVRDSVPDVDDPDAEDASGGADREPWFARAGFDPAAAIATVARVLERLREFAPGRYVLSHACGRDAAAMYREATATDEGGLSSRGRGRGRGRGGGRGRRHAGGDFAGLEAEKGAHTHGVASSSTRVAPLPAPRDPDPDPTASDPTVVYDLHAAFEVAAADSYRADVPLDVLPPAIPAVGQVRRTFAPRGEPPQPGARKSRKMWTSLLAAPRRVDGDGDGDGDGVRDRVDTVDPSSRHPIPGFADRDVVARRRRRGAWTSGDDEGGRVGDGGGTRGAYHTLASAAVGANPSGWAAAKR